MIVLTILIVIAFVGVVFGCISMICEWDNLAVTSHSIGGISFIVAVLFGVLYPTCSNAYNEPTALDVYRGKTTLVITYRDSVAIDSMVVYKVR